MYFTFFYNIVYKNKIFFTLQQTEQYNNYSVNIIINMFSMNNFFCPNYNLRSKRPPVIIYYIYM